MTDLRHVAEVLHEAAQRDGLGLNALLEWLRVAMAQDAPAPVGPAPAASTVTRRPSSW